MRNRMKKLLSLSLALLLLLALLPGGVLAAEAEGYTYSLDGSGNATVTGYTGSATELIIPSTLDGHPVKAIGKDAFAFNSNLTSVTIPDSVISIGWEAFVSCTGLKNVTLPAHLNSIGEYAFAYCFVMADLTIPASVTSIGFFAFLNCVSLRVTIPASVDHIGSGAFAGCFSSIEVDPDNPYFCSEDGALFSKDKTTLLTLRGSYSGSYLIPSSVTAIDDYAFAYCYYLSGVTIPDSVTSIGVDAFDGCSRLTDISVSSRNPNYCSEEGVLFSKDKAKLVRFPAGIEGSYSIPSSVTTIERNAFGSSKLTSIEIPASVTSIGINAFTGCSGLTSVTIPSSVTCIDNFTFSGCSNLTSVTIPNSVTSIHSEAFYNCTSLTDVYYSGTREEWDAIAISDTVVTAATIHYLANSVTITTQPTNVTVAAGSTATFKVIAVGATSYQWYYRTSSTGSWTVVSADSGKTAAYSLTVKEQHNGYQYYCKVSNSAGSVSSNTVTLTVSSGKPTITTQPKNYVGAAGSTATATVVATGEGLTYQWYFKNPGASSFTKSGSKTATYSATLTEANSGRKLYCVIKDANGNTVTTNTVTMSIGSAVAITTQPKNYVGAAGSTATATVKATGTGLTYQWYFKNPGASSFTKSGSKTATYSATLTEANSGRKLYCVIKDSLGNSVTTNTVTMSIGSAVAITTQPKNYVGAIGSTATATVKASGEGLTYQWYFKNPGATSFTKSGSKTATYSATLTAANSGRRMYCVITDASGNSVRTNTVTMMASLSITTQPKNYVGAVGSTATATVKASGEGLTYQWYFANPGATSFTKSGSKTATYSATLTAANSGRRMYCVITDASGNSVRTNTVTMTASLSITTQPKNYVGTIGSTATATVKATGEGLTYQWYFANPGATSFTKSGSKTATYSATLTAANSGRRMYCVITDASGNTVTSNTVTMKIG